MTSFNAVLFEADWKHYRKVFTWIDAKQIAPQTHSFSPFVLGLIILCQVPKVGEAYLFILCYIAQRKHGKKWFVFVCFVDVTGVDATIRVATVILWKTVNIGASETVSMHTYKETGELNNQSAITSE